MDPTNEQGSLKESAGSELLLGMHGALLAVKVKKGLVERKGKGKSQPSGPGYQHPAARNTYMVVEGGAQPYEDMVQWWPLSGVRRSSELCQ